MYIFGRGELKNEIIHTIDFIFFFFFFSILFYFPFFFSFSCSFFHSVVGSLCSQFEQFCYILFQFTFWLESSRLWIINDSWRTMCWTKCRQANNKETNKIKMNFSFFYYFSKGNENQNEWKIKARKRETKKKNRRKSKWIECEVESLFSPRFDGKIVCSMCVTNILCQNKKIGAISCWQR